MDPRRGVAVGARNGAGSHRCCRLGRPRQADRGGVSDPGGGGAFLLCRQLYRRRRLKLPCGDLIQDGFSLLVGDRYVVSTGETIPPATQQCVIDCAYRDIVADRFDAGTRLDEKLERDMVALKVGPDLGMAAVATADYLARSEAVVHPSDLTRHR